MKKQAERFNKNYVDHDYETKLAEQSDWYSRDNSKRKEWHEKNNARKSKSDW